ncbi:hypothetical protein BRC82_06635 [Halobacteriales archaeon QS_1_67_19]|nr:MAG: hypothetical protein BRC82_06635 [Halobacteriales archaeon QS_1_67_19]
MDQHFSEGVDADRAPSQRVVDAVTAATDADPTEMEPLHDVVDPDALDQLFAKAETAGYVEFPYADCTVTVRPSGEVEVVGTDLESGPRVLGAPEASGEAR